MKMKPKWRQFSNFLPFFCQISLTETFPIKIFEFLTFFDKFRQISLRERLSVSPPMKIMPKWRQFSNFLTFFDKFRQIPLRETFFHPPNENHAEMAQIFGIFDNF